MKAQPENHSCFLTFLMDYFADRKGVKIMLKDKGIHFNYENEDSYVTEKELDEVFKIWNEYAKKKDTYQE